MILRVFQVTVRDGKAAEFENFFRTIALPQLQEWPGLVAAMAGKPLAGAPNKFCMTMIWEDVEALKSFAGKDWRQAKIVPEEKDLIAEADVEHFDLIGTAGGWTDSE